jgi:hypothetical protein
VGKRDQKAKTPVVCRGWIARWHATYEEQLYQPAVAFKLAAAGIEKQIPLARIMTAIMQKNDSALTSA